MAPANASERWRHDSSTPRLIVSNGMLAKLAPENSVCGVCGSPRLRRFSARAYDADKSSRVSIVECRSCAFAWQFPLARSEHESSEWFDAAYYGTEADKSAYSAYFSVERKREIARLELDFVETLSAPVRRLLDIGAGAGVFASEAAARGWAVTALDPALDPLRIEKSERLEAFRGTLEVLRDDRKFGVVTLWDVIEHTSSPQEVLSQATRHLEPGGWIVVETGNYKSAARALAGPTHWIYQLDHRWYFAPDSIRLLLKSVGFREFVLPDRVLRPKWNGNAAYEGPSRRKLLDSVLGDPLRLAAHLGTFRRLRTARTWSTAGLEIFAIAARRD